MKNVNAEAFTAKITVPYIFELSAPLSNPHTLTLKEKIMKEKLFVLLLQKIKINEYECNK